MVHNQVEDDPDTSAVGRLQELREVTQRAQPGMHGTSDQQLCPMTG
jgi:hypothetical protein